MKRKRLTAVALAAMLGISMAKPVWAADWQSGNPLVAHALGEVDGKIETNSKEAFIQAWENGFRVVEGDFTYTSDGILVVRHDFEKNGSYTRLEIPTEQDRVMDSQTYLSTPAVYTLTPMRAVDLLYLMAEYPDMYLVTDTKDTDKKTVQRQFNDLKTIAYNIEHPEVLNRIIPQLYNKEMIGWVREIYPFENWIFTLYLYQNPNYDDIASYCVSQGIQTVTLHVDRATKANVSKLKAKGLKVYAHTTNRYLTMQTLLAAGVDGIYTDRIKPYELPWVGLENSRKLTEQAIGAEGTTVTTLDIFGKTYAPLRQLAKIGRGFSAKYEKDTGSLYLQIGKTFQSLGNEMLMNDSGRLITKKADFKLFIDGAESNIQCFYVDGEVYAPVEEMLALIQK